ncbi:MAG: ABC transporter ATP-binding protein [Azoarcus sp.]|jgi:putative ABC transport system ATP-binding protein|nr:ABC transporter ATP-binding protein [Azoarcus sp.]
MENSPPLENPPLLKVSQVWKRYRRGEETIEALRGVSFVQQSGEFVMLGGESGSGKSTLLNLCGCLDVPDEGQIALLGNEVAGMPESRRARVRRDFIGFIFQDFHLIPVLTAIENVEYALKLRRQKISRPQAMEMLDRVGLAGQANARVTALSGGQMQRVAIARALVTRPRLVLADEPTANLDARNKQAIMQLLGGLCRDAGVGVLLVTHDQSQRCYANRVIRLCDGEIREDAPARDAATKEAVQ